MADDADLQQRIRERAFKIWLDEGCPDGRDKEHWARAEREISGNGAFKREAPPQQPEPIGEVKYAQENAQKQAKKRDAQGRLVDGGEGQPPYEKH